MNEPHGIGICDITSFFSDKFHEEQTWVYLDIVDETREPSLWHWIGLGFSSQVRPLISYSCQQTRY